MAKRYGMRIYSYGVELRGGGPRWNQLPLELLPWRAREPRVRGLISAWSRASAKRLSFITANADLCFASHLTLTYRARQEAWESEGDRNRRFVQRCQADRHRFLRCLRKEMGGYLWVREFQARGVVHFHVLTEQSVAQDRATEAWARASDQLEDEAVLRHGVKADAIASQRGVRRYLGTYIGKEKQKELPPGVDGAGRWWGSSRGLPLALLEDVIWRDAAEDFRKPVELRMVRVLRRYIAKRFKRPFRGGVFVDYGGKLVATLLDLAVRLRAHYGSSPEVPVLLDRYDWELYGKGEGDGQVKVAWGDGQPGVAGDAASGAGGEGRGDGGGTVNAELWDL
jgi:hypothetical protein